MRKLALIFMVFALHIQCEERNSGLLIAEDELIPILADLYTANMAVSKFPEDLQDSVSRVYRENISRIHQVEIGIIDSCVRFIQSDPKLNFDINDKVLLHFENIKKEGFSPINEDD